MHLDSQNFYTLICFPPCTMKKRAVVALGGNALIKKGQKGTIYEQFANTRQVASFIVHMIQEDWNLVVTHGNGPQVGAILLQNEYARNITPSMPLGICVSESEGLIGYMIQQCLSNALFNIGLEKSVVTLITQVIVDPKDPSFSSPTKPIGPYYEEKDVQRLKDKGYQVTQQQQGWRIVVPSPDPLSIVEKKVIRKLLDEDILIVAAGGGGMPVIKKEGWGLDGVEAVVDKDLASERLAEEIDANLLMILTNVEYVYLNYGTKEQSPLKDLTLKDLQKYYDQGHFPPGSMGPKIQAALRFLQQGGKKVIISDVDKGWQALQGTTGTHIIP
jgi:carbamate kinase